MVTTRPMANPPSNQGMGSPAAPIGMAGVKALIRATSPWPRPRPTSVPVSDASTPTMIASRRIDRISCRRVAPTQRSSAKSRSRCANRMENVFAMTRTETKIAMPANNSSITDRLSTRFWT